MADKSKGASKGDKAAAGSKSDKPKKPDEAAKAAKAVKDAEAAVAEAEGKKAGKEAPRPPADPRAKVWKKFQGRFLPRGPLRDRFRKLESRWNSGEDHGGVTLDELKQLLSDWRSSRVKRVKTPA